MSRDKAGTCVVPAFFVCARQGALAWNIRGKVSIMSDLPDGGVPVSVSVSKFFVSLSGVWEPRSTPK